MMEQHPFLWQELIRERQKSMLMERSKATPSPRLRRARIREALASWLIQFGLRLQGSHGPWRCASAAEHPAKTSHQPSCRRHGRAVPL